MTKWLLFSRIDPMNAVIKYSRQNVSRVKIDSLLGPHWASGWENSTFLNLRTNSSGPSTFESSDSFSVVVFKHLKQQLISYSNFESSHSL